jgi:hypothetical protein
MIFLAAQHNMHVIVSKLFHKIFVKYSYFHWLFFQVVDTTRNLLADNAELDWTRPSDSICSRESPLLLQASNPNLMQYNDLFSRKGKKAE